MTGETSQPDRRVVLHAAHVVERCLSERAGPAAVMAEMPALRAEPDAVRARVARVTAQVLAGHRRFRAVLGDRRPEHPAERARAYVWMCLAEAGQPLPKEARDLPDREDVRRALRDVRDDTQRFALTHAVPEWLVEPLRDAFGDELDAVLDALQAAPPRTLRSNELRVASRDDLLARLHAEGVEAQPARFARSAVHVSGAQDLFRTRAYQDGCFEQQDEASQLAVLATAPNKGGKVLDLCCGSGGKTLGLASLLGNRGIIMASDVHAARLRELRQRLPRSGADNVQPLHADGSDRSRAKLETFATHADRILIDAPCTGTGSWRRRPQARWHVGPDDLQQMLATQRELLERAAGWLKPGARLVYATCSLLPAENERQVEQLLALRPELEQVRLAEVLGGELARPITDATGTFLSLRPDVHGCDGFFAAVLRRRRS